MKTTRLKIVVIRACLVLGLSFLLSGCESVKLDGFSVGVVYLNTDLTTSDSIDAGGLGNINNQRNIKVEGVMPVVLLNFKFE